MMAKSWSGTDDSADLAAKSCRFGAVFSRRGAEPAKHLFLQPKS
jgi:hypothetical protein